MPSVSNFLSRQVLVLSTEAYQITGGGSCMAAGQKRGKVAPENARFLCRNDRPRQWHVCCPFGNSRLLPANALFELPFFSHPPLSATALKWPNFEGLEAPGLFLF